MHFDHQLTTVTVPRGAAAGAGHLNQKCQVHKRQFMMDPSKLNKNMHKIAICIKLHKMCMLERHKDSIRFQSVHEN
jgi:hypothetical protein